MQTEISFITTNREAEESIEYVKMDLAIVPKVGDYLIVVRRAPKESPVWNFLGMAGEAYREVIEVQNVAMMDIAEGNNAVAVEVFGTALTEACGSLRMLAIGGASKVGLPLNDDSYAVAAICAAFGRILNERDMPTAKSHFVNFMDNIRGVVGGGNNAVFEAGKALEQVVGKAGRKAILKNT